MKKMKFVWLALSLMLALFFVGCEEAKEDDPVQFKVTVTDLPAANSGYVWGASLMDLADPTTPVASGQLVGGSCFFYEVKADMTPDFTKPFNKNGSYIVGISQATPAGDPDMSTVKSCDGEGTGFTFNKDNPTQTIAYADFSPVMPEDPVQFKLTITDLPAANTGYVWGASLMALTAPTTPVATGAFMGGSCAFYEATADGTPDFTKPFSTEGSYIISIVQSTLSSEPDMTTMRMYMGTGGVVFNESNLEAEIPYASFTAPLVP